MEDFTCSKPPDLLYRVHYPESATEYTPADGFEAAYTSTTFDSSEIDHFKQALERQFKWSHHGPTPFITLFSDRQHAEHWGAKTPWQQSASQDWSLFVIDGSVLDETNHLFTQNTLVRTLQLAIPAGAQQHIEGAYLCLHRIPAAAIIDERTPGRVHQDQQDRRCHLSEEPDIYDHLGEYGDADSDREMLQENYNSIFERAFEGNW